MKTVLVGYGRMGREIEAILLQRGHTVTARIDPAAPGADAPKLAESHLKDADGVIEFALPAEFLTNADLYTRCGVPAVVGTTGWLDRKDQVERMVTERNAALLYGSNFSVGVHMFLDLAGRLAQMIGNFPDFDIMVHEYHHRLKADSPSGTALSTADRILAALPRKTAVQTQALDRPIRPEELHVSSTRGGRIFGIHTVTADSPSDTIELTHTAHNRQGFALGAVMALEWLQGRKGFLPVERFMDEVLERMPRDKE